MVLLNRGVWSRLPAKGQRAPKLSALVGPQQLNQNNPAERLREGLRLFLLTRSTESGSHSAEIAKAAGLREDQVIHRLRHGLGAAHGIGHNRDDAGVVTIVLPDGVPAEALIAGEAKAAAKGKAVPVHSLMHPRRPVSPPAFARC